LKDGSIDAITFTSASTVRGFIASGGTVERSVRIVCIGPVTAKEARAQGLRVHQVADPHTTDGLVAALERAFSSRPRR
jgi:uroporphyrinogen-III synthase